MATYAGLTLNDTTYAGEVASNFIKNAVIGAETINGGNVYVKDGIKKQFTIPTIKVENMIQDYSTKPNSSGTTTVDKKVLSPETYMIYAEFDPHDFEDHWYAPEMQEALIGRNLPQTAEAAITMAVLDYHNDYFDKAIWQGSKTGSTPYNKFDGLVQKAQDDSSVLDVTTTATAITTSNIFAELEKVYQKIPVAVRYKQDMKIFMSQATFAIYESAQAAQTNKGVDVTQRGTMFYKGVKVVPLGNFPNSTMIAAIATSRLDSNVWVGINSTQDTTVQIGKVQNNSDAMFVKVLFKADTQYGISEEVVLYKI